MLIKKINRRLAGLMQNIALLLCLATFIMDPLDLRSQESTYYDSLQMVRNRLQENRLDSAKELLGSLAVLHAADEHFQRLKGKALYWSKDFYATKSYLASTLEQYPSHLDLKLDYARILFELNDQAQARMVLENYLEQRPADVEANIKMATLLYWSGSAIEKAMTYVDKVLKTYPENADALSLQKQLKATAAPWLLTDVGYYTDSQPMQYFLGEVRSGFYHSAALQPRAALRFRAIDGGANAWSAMVGNKTFIPSTGTTIELDAGVFNASWSESIKAVWEAALSQKVVKDIKLGASVAHQPYLYTLASNSALLMPMHYQLSLGRKDGKKWIGELFYDRWQFEDDNYVHSYGAWAMAPIVKIPLFKLQLGYGYTKGNSGEVKFEAKLPITDHANSTNPGTVIEGVYSPYFTPINQLVHSALVKFDWQVSKQVSIVASGNVGVSAHIDNPNMIFYGLANPGNRPINPGESYLELFREKYTPVTIDFSINAHASRAAALHVNYAWQQTIFFNSHQVRAGVLWKFWHE